LVTAILMTSVLRAVLLGARLAWCTGDTGHARTSLQPLQAP
jgi:hypothetical protein